MKKVLSIIAWAIVAIGLIIGGIVCFVNYNSMTIDVPTDVAVKSAGWVLGTGIALFCGGASSAIASIASFFSTKVKEK